MRNRLPIVILCCSIIFWIIGCRKELAAPPVTGLSLMEIPAGFPAMPETEGNHFTEERWQLGKRLFYDKQLSLHGMVSCASCHKQELAFSDNLPLSPGDNDAAGVANAPTLTNIGYNPYFTRAGGVPTLEMQVLVPIQEHNEFNTSILDIADKLSKDSSYRSMAQAAYGRKVDPFTITRALACFERSLISGNSRFDQFNYQGNKEALSAKEQEGMRLFFSERTNCSRCHADFNFTNYAFENNGLYLKYADSGRMRLTKEEADRDKFKVPTLRNVALTGPYMHDGSIATLEAVVEHYNSGGKNNINKSGLVRPLHLTDVEKEALIAFLHTLSDDGFTSNKIFRNE